MQPRTHIKDAVLANASADLTEEQVRAVEDFSVTATEMACRNRRPLLDWEEYRRVAL